MLVELTLTLLTLLLTVLCHDNFLCGAQNATKSGESRRYGLPEVEGYDGWYNNPAHPEWGGADMPLSRSSFPDYKDGSYQPSGGNRPNPHDIATACMAGPKGLKSFRNRTALLTFFGQQVVEEILDAQRPGCPPEYFNIPIPRCHALYDPDCKGDKEVPFLRSRFDKSTGQSPNNPRQQLNEITPYLDGGLFYGVTKAWSDALRSLVNGTLACSDSTCRFPAKNTIGLPMANPPPPADHVLKSSKRFHKLGNPRGNENPMLLAMGVIWFRNHNWHADRLRREWDEAGIGYNDEILYNRARQWNIAEHQHIVLDVWLPRFLGVAINPYRGYSTTVFPGISHAFQTSAMRFGHTLVPPAAYRAQVRNSSRSNWACDFRPLDRRQSGGKSTSVRTCQSYWNSPDIAQEDGGDAVDELLFGLSKQVTEREDNIVTEDLRGFVFGSLDVSRRDLMALNIQRGRDHGVPAYNSVRDVFGLPRIESFDEINNSTDPFVRSAIANLSRLYEGNVDNIDLWPGGLLETTERGPGPLFTAIIQDQYERIRDSDRFWFENRRNGLFSDAEIRSIKNVTFRTIMVRNIQASWFRPEFLQDDVFAFNRDVDDPDAHCWAAFETYSDADLARELEPCSVMRTFDYFSGSEIPYVLTICSLCVYFLLNIMVLVLSIRWMKRRRRKGALIVQNANSVEESKESAGMWRDADIFVDHLNEPLTADIIGQGEVKNVVMKRDGRQLKAHSTSSGAVERVIDLVGVEVAILRFCYTRKYDKTGLLCLRVPHRYDLLLRVEHGLSEWLVALKNYLELILIEVEQLSVPKEQILSDVVTKEDRQHMVEVYLRTLFKEMAFPGHKASRKFAAVSIQQVPGRKKKQALTTELTRTEFAEAVGMTESSLFVGQVFQCIDGDGSGSIAFQEFLQFLATLTAGSPDNKMELMFRIYDLDGDGMLDCNEFITMLRHLTEQAGEEISTEKLDALLDSMMEASGIEGISALTLQDFKKVFSSYEEVLTESGMLMRSRKKKTAMTSRRSFCVDARRESTDPSPLEPTRKRTLSHEPCEPAVDELSSGSTESEVLQVQSTMGDVVLTSRKSLSVESRRGSTDLLLDPAEKTTLVCEPALGQQSPVSTQPTVLRQRCLYLQRQWGNYRFHVFWATLYFGVVACIFVERAYYYSIEREHIGLRRIAGYGVTVTRGAASAMMFTYSSLLVTMCRNLITKLRETPLNRVMPFDAAFSAHTLIAVTAAFFTVVHVIGHCINFYHISTQTPNDLTCLFREYYHLSSELPKFHYWMFGTLTGVTGFLLTLLVITMYVFALARARLYLFDAFWWTHRLYYALFPLLILHGSGRLVQPPIFQWFFILPAFLFTCDKLVSLRRKKHMIRVCLAEKLPSGVTHLQMNKPKHFTYLSGQWCRIACTALNSSEFHPFTITSAPNEDTIDLYIRAVGPWTRNIRQVFDPENPKNGVLRTGQPVFPSLYLDGPFGEGRQDWYKYDVSVLVGGGIGVTPFASILKDLCYKQQSKIRIRCQKVYFLWVTKTQKQFEWLTDIIRQVESMNMDDFTEVHIFITQFYQKFDLRTIMLYICEHHFQKTSKRSLFTGLQSKTHFGRPHFDCILENLQLLHSDVSCIGTFSCGPPPMTRSVESACTKCNQNKGPVFSHHYENF